MRWCTIVCDRRRARASAKGKRGARISREALGDCMWTGALTRHLAMGLLVLHLNHSIPEFEDGCGIFNSGMGTNSGEETLQ